MDSSPIEIIPTDSPANATNQTSDSEVVANLARLSHIDYDRQRTEAAQRLGVSLSALDADVRAARSKRNQSTDGEARSFKLEDPEPWPNPVCGAALLDDLVAAIHRFVVMPRDSEYAAALWILFTWFIDVVGVAPILAITSPEKGCGKTTMTDVLRSLVRRPLPCANITPAALFRVIEAHQPTLLIDEGDAFLRDQEAMRGILNSGHTRSTAFVIRTAPETFEPQQFSTWGAKSIAMIGKLPDTLRDRSIPIELRRKLPTEEREKFRHSHGSTLQDLRSRAARFALDMALRIARYAPPTPEGLHNRAADNWEPLLAIADVAGGKWPQLARDVALRLAASITNADDSLAVRLLSDVRDVFEQSNQDRIGSEDLVRRLTSDEAKPWGEMVNGKGLDARRLHAILGKFEIPAASSMRLPNGSNRKGYKLENFAEAFSRYLPAYPPADPSHRHEQGSTRVSSDSAPVTIDGLCRIELPSQASAHAGCDDVTEFKREGVDTPLRAHPTLREERFA